MKKQNVYSFSILLIALIFSGCLKTRTMVKGDDDNADDSQNVSGTAKTVSAKPSHYELEELKNEITRISGKLEELEHEQKGMNTADTNQNVAKLDMRVADLEKNQMLIMTELKDLKDRSNSESESKSEPPSKKGGKSASSKTLLQDGYSLLMAKNYDGAADKFKEFGEKNPKGKEAAEMHFGLGEAAYGQKAWKKAIVEYSKVQESFSKSPRIPAALLKIGLCFEQLGSAKDGQSFFQELLERFPQSPEAKKAKSKLKKS